MMKSKITKALALAAAVLGLQAFTNTAMAEGENPAIWYKFDGNWTSSGSSSLTISGENTNNFSEDAVDNQALKITDGATHPWGSGWNYGSAGAWAVTTLAKPVANASNKIVIWTSGVKGGWFGLLSDSANNKMILAAGNGSGVSTTLCEVSVSDLTTAYHLYTVRFVGNNTYELIVDGNVSGKSTKTGYSTSVPSGNYQIGAVQQGLPTGLARTTGTLIDDLRIYQRSFSDDEVKALYAYFFDYTVISVNLGTSGQSGRKTTTGTDPGGLFADTKWHNVSDAKTTNRQVGPAILSCTAKENYQWDSLEKVYLKGYLDDGTATGVTGPSVTISNLKNGDYDVVIYCSTDGDENRDFTHKTVNGTNYKWDSTAGKAVVGTGSWGANLKSASATEPGNHAMLIEGIKVSDGTITITSVRDGTTSHRGCISAIQVMRAVERTATVSAGTTWSNLQWEGGVAPATTEFAKLNVTAASTLTIDKATTVAKLTVVSTDAKLTIASPTNLHATSYDFSSAAGKVAFDCSGLTAPATLISGTITGSANVDTAGSTVPTGTHLYADATGVYLVTNFYQEKFGNNPLVLTFAGTGSSSATAQNFHNGPFNPFDINKGAPTGQSFPGNTATTQFPGWEGTSITPWHVFASNKTGYRAPGYVLRFASGTGTAGGMDADFNPMDVGGMIVETGATGWYFNSNKQNSARPLNLGDKRTTGAVATWFVFNEDFTFSRYSYGSYQEQTILSLCGEINFEIASGKTVALNNDTTKGCPNPVLDTTTSARLKMHGAGTLTANLNATGDVTLDYSDLPYNRATAYISGTLTINDSTVIKLPANLPENTAFKMATTLSGATSGRRTIYVGGVSSTKLVTFDASAGTISYSDAIFEAEVATSGKWSDIQWNPSKPSGGFASNADLTLRNTAPITVTMDEVTKVAKLTVVNATGNALTIPYAGLANLTIATYDFSQAAGGVVIDLNGITAGEQTVVTWNVTGGADKVSCTNVPTGWGTEITATGIKLWRSDTLTRTNPVVGGEAQYNYAFVGSSSVDWGTVANWRVRSNNLLKAHTGNVPGAQDSGIYEPILVDGALMGALKDVTYQGGTLDGWAINYAFLNGAHATVPTLRKIQEPDNPMSIWVDATSSFAVSALGDGSYEGVLNLYVAAENGVTFPAYAKGNTFNYYLAKNGSVKFTGTVTDGTHTIQRVDLAIGESKEGAEVVTRKLISYSSGTTATFTSSGATVTSDNPDVTPKPKAGVPTEDDPVGTYCISTGTDALYLYYVTYADNKMARIDETQTKYDTLAAAIEAVQDGQTITLLNNCTEAIATAKTFTFVPNGRSFTGAVTVNQGGVLTIDGGVSCTLSGLVTLDNGGKLITKGVLSLSNGSNVAKDDSTIEVATGTLTYECGKESLSADLTVRSGATYVQGSTTRQDDQLNFNVYQTINVYGALNLSGSRWSVKTKTTINLYPGAVITGEGQSTYGAIDAADATATINAKKDGETGGTATISARLRPRGNPGFVYNVEEGMTLALTGTLGDKANGFRKEGAGTLLVSSAYATTGAITLVAGTVKIGNTGALGTSTLAFAGGTLDLNGLALTGKTTSGNGKVTNTSDTTASFNGFPVAKGKEYDVSGTSLSITLDDSDTFTLSSVPAENAIKFHGSGMVIYDNATPPTLPTGIWGSDWTGTFKYTGLNANKTAWDLRSYYNGTLSKFEFGGTMTGGYFYDGAFSVGELVLSGSMKFTDGYTSTGGSVNNYVFTKISGSGTFEIASTTTASPGVKFADVSGFTGTIKNTGNGSNGYRVMLGDGDLLAVGDNPAKAAIHFTGNATLQNLTLQAGNGIKVTGDAVVTIPAGKTPTFSSATDFAAGASLGLADKDSKLAVNAAVTVASDVTIPVKITNATGLAAGKELITWTAQPTGSFSFSVESGVEAGQKGFKATKSGSALAVAVDDTTTYYEVGGATERQPTVFEDKWLTDAGVKAETTAKTQENLDKKNAYDVKASDAYLMGYAANEVETAAIVLASQPASLSDKVRLVIQGVPAVSARRNGAVVTYTVKSSTSQTMEDPEKRDIGESTMVDMALPESGVLYYRIEATIDISGTKSEPIPAVVPSADIVDPGMPLLTEPGAKFAAALGQTTVTEATASMTFQLGGAGVYEGQEYHLEVNEANESPLQTKSLKLTTSSASASNESYGMVAKVLSDKTVTFDFGHEVGVGTTCKLTLIGEGGAANGNVVVKSPAMTGTTANMDEVIVSARMGFLPYEDGIATAQAPDMPQQYRIPAIATDGQGEVIACYDCRYGKSDLGATWSCPLNTHGTVYSGIDIAENYSSDNGKTFSGSYLAVDVGNMRDQTGAWIGGYANRNNGSYIVKERDIGDVCVLFDPAGNGGDGLYWMMGITGGGLSTTGTGGDKVDVVLYTRARGKDSKWVEWNNGKGSTDPLQYRSVKWQILDSLGVTTETLGQGFLEGPGHGIVTTKACTIKGANVPAGTLVFPIQCFLSGGTKSGAAYSTDHGATWKATALTDTDSAPQENCVMELDDGTWYMCCKCNSAGYYRTYRYNHSTDAWVKVENGAYCPSSREGSCLRMGVGSDGKGRYAICHARNDRANVVVYFGTDMTTPGETPSTTNKGIQWDWDNYITIHKENTSGGYSSMCMVDDTTLGILYESAYGAANDGGTDVSGCRMYFTRINVSDKVVPPAK